MSLEPSQDGLAALKRDDFALIDRHNRFALRGKNSADKRFDLLVDVEFGLSRMGYEIAGGRCANIAAGLGSRLIDVQSQKMTAAARAIAERKTFGHLS